MVYVGGLLRVALPGGGAVGGKPGYGLNDLR
jgi:hypothetical protein